jgi:hypothetical protein
MIGITVSERSGALAHTRKLQLVFSLQALKLFRTKFLTLITFTLAELRMNNISMGYDRFLSKNNFKLAYFRLRNASKTLYKSIY